MRTTVLILIGAATVLLSVTACDTSKKWKPNQEIVSGGDEYAALSDYAKRVMRHRDSTSAMFLSGANGILPKSDLSPTGKLSYFAPDKVFRVKATFESIPNGAIFEMKTSTDRLPKYKRYGTLRFKLSDADLTLTLYKNVEQPDYLFCPFKDLTNTKSTYGAGRYLDFKLADLESPIIDFNYAYNPYCAYNTEFSCPIPPVENSLNIPIPAGEKNWH
ncbi:MAG: DUF1684 domain-containing protein [Bacteroidia bacterium]|nr:DUF1684 domain-containing protein [Bacteroidia bacterium]